MKRLRRGEAFPISFAPMTDRQEWRSGQVLEWDEGGVFIGCNSLWPPRTVLELIVTLPSERMPHRVQGEVSWARSTDPAGMYVLFMDQAVGTTARAGQRPSRPPAPKLASEG